MASDVAQLEKLFRENILSVPELVSQVGAKIFNSVAPAGATAPYSVFQVIPLQDNFGQARTSIQSVFLIDFKIYCPIPFDAGIDEAIADVKERFRGAETFTTDNYRVSIRHDRPISVPVKGATADEKLIMRGSTYRAWMSRI